MGCLFGCFGGGGNRKSRKRRSHGSPPRQLRNGGHIPLQDAAFPLLGTLEKAGNLVPESSETYVKSLEHVTFTENTDSLLEKTDKSSETDKEDDLAKPEQPHVNTKDDLTTSSVAQNHRYQNCRDSDEGDLESIFGHSSSTRRRVMFNSYVTTYEHEPIVESADLALEVSNDSSEREKEKGLAKSRGSQTNSVADSLTSSVGSYPQNHRYQNCADSDDEGAQLEYEESVTDDEFDDESLLCQEVWSETIPAASVESRSEISLARAGSEEVNSPMTWCLPDQEEKKSKNDHTVLNAVENLSQWKAVKSKETSPLKPLQKENSAAGEEAPHMSLSSKPRHKSSFNFQPQLDHQANNLYQDEAIDGSLSNWLVSSETTSGNKISPAAFGTISPEKSMSQGSTSVMSIEDRPILGALTLEELKQFSASSSPRKSPCRSPDDMPIIGTVGTYWNHTSEIKDSGSPSSYKGIPNTTSKYRGDKKVNWHSTPFETRLERALNNGASA